MRTLTTLRTLTHAEALLLARLASFVWTVDGDPLAILRRRAPGEEQPYDLVYGELLLLQDAGLIAIEDALAFEAPSGVLSISYFTSKYRLTLLESRRRVQIGRVAATTAAEELFRVCNAEPIADYRDETLQWFSSSGITAEPL